MTTFDQRDKNFENKFAHDKELAFKIKARRNKLLGLWAAEKLGKKGAEAETYAKSIVLADAGQNGENEIIKKLEADFAAAKVPVAAKDIRVEMYHLLGIAQKELAGS